MGVDDAKKYNYCVASHAEANAINQAAKFGIALNGAVIYCTLEPCNWCFKQLVQAGIKEVYYEETYESINRQFDLYWRRAMKLQDGVVFRQMSVSQEVLDQAIEVLRGSSCRRLAVDNLLLLCVFTNFLPRKEVLA